MSGSAVEDLLALWLAELLSAKARIRPLFRQPSSAASAATFLDGLLGPERRKTGWMRAEAAGDPGPWRQQAVLGRSHWDADALRDLVRDHALETLAHAGRSGRRVVSAFIATAFAEEDAASARVQWRQVADQLRPKLPKLATLLDTAEEDVLAYMTFPKEHRAKIHSTNPIERLIGEIKRRTEVVGIFPNEAAITRLVGAVLLEANDEWAVQRARYMTLESITTLGDDPAVMLPAVAA
jgi:hypothetical protein